MDTCIHHLNSWFTIVTWLLLKFPSPLVSDMCILLKKLKLFLASLALSYHISIDWTLPLSNSIYSTIACYVTVPIYQAPFPAILELNMSQGTVFFLSKQTQITVLHFGERKQYPSTLSLAAKLFNYSKECWVNHLNQPAT